MTASSPQPTRRNPALWIIFFIMLMDIVGLTILFPVAPFVVQRYSDNASMVTTLSVIYSAAQFVAAPALGHLSDRVGRRPVLIACVFGSAIGYFIFGIGGSLAVLFLSRLIDGITGGNISTAGAYIADVSQPHERAKNFALMGLAWGMGFIIGPALGTAASVISLDAPAYLAGIIALVSVAVMWVALPESLPPERRTGAPFTPASLNPFKSIGQLSGKPGMPVLMGVMLAFSFAFAALSTVQNVYVARRFQVAPDQLGMWLLLGGVGTAISQFVLSDKAYKRFGERTMGLASLGIQSAGALLLILAPAFAILMLAAPVLGMMRPFIWGALGALMAAKVQPREQGVLSGVNTALQSATSIFGPFAAGALYDFVSPQSPFVMAFVFFGVAFAILMTVKPATKV